MTNKRKESRIRIEREQKKGKKEMTYKEMQDAVIRKLGFEDGQTVYFCRLCAGYKPEEECRNRLIREEWQWIMLNC